MKAKVLVATAINQVEIKSVDLPEPGPGEALVETLYSCISPGTELRCLAGKQQGTSFPFIPGYAMVVRVLKCGSGVSDQGRQHGFSDGHRARRPVQHFLGRAREPRRDPCRTSAAHPGRGGFGAGLGCKDGVDSVSRASHGRAVAGREGGGDWARCHRAHGCKTLHVNGRTHGGLRRFGRSRRSCSSRWRSSRARWRFVEANLCVFLSRGRRCRRRLHGCTGAGAQGDRGVSWLPWGNHEKRGPRYVFQGSYPDEFTVPYGGVFLREMTLLVPRSEQDRDRVIIYDLLKRGALSLKSVISDVCKPADGPKVYQSLLEPGTNLMTFVFDWKA